MNPEEHTLLLAKLLLKQKFQSLVCVITETHIYLLKEQ